MGDLARRRAALDLRISRSHLKAAAVGIVLISGISFGLGVVVGRDLDGPSAEPEAGLLSAVPDDAVVELLARVEAAAPTDGRTDLTFPDALRGVTPLGAHPDVGPETPGTHTQVPPADPVAPATADALPEGLFTVEVWRSGDPDAAHALRAHLQVQQVQAFVQAALVDGLLEYRVAVGGFSSEQRALAAVEAVELALQGAPVGAEPTVAALP